MYYAYWLLNQAGQPTAAYLARWSMPSGRRLPTVQLGSGPLLAVALIDRGAEVMIVTAHDIESYDSRTLRLERSVTIGPAPASPSAAAISPDGTTIAIGSDNGSVSFIDAATGAARPGHGGHAAAVASAVYAPDGRTVMTAGDDGRVIIWDPATATEAAVLSGPGGHVEDAKVSPDGSTLYTSALGGVVLAWDLTGERGFGHSAPLDRALPCCDTVSPPEPALALSPDGSRFAAQIAPSTVGLFSTHTLARLGSFTIAPADDPITALAWSPSGGMLAVGAHGGLVQVWRVNGAPRLERSLHGLAPVPGLAEAVQSLAFSPDGQLLAATDKSEGTTLGHTLASPLATMATWNVSAGMLVGPAASLGAGNGLTGSDEVAFSRDGKLLAASLLVGGVSVFDPSTGQLLRTLADPGDENTSVAFGTGDTLAAGTIGGAVELWDAATGKRLAPPLLADTEEITDVAFDQSGGRFVTTGDEDGTIKLWFTAGLQQEGPRLASDPDSTAAAAFEPGDRGLLVVDDHGDAFTWPTSLAAWEQRACSVAGRNLTRAEWAELVGGPRYTSVCP